MKKIERLGYFEMVRAGYTGLRGALKRVIYDSSLTSEDQASISNHSISETIISEGNTVARYTKGTKRTINKRVDDNTAITFEQALLVCSQSLKTDSDILALERLIATGITLDQLKQAYPI